MNTRPLLDEHQRRAPRELVEHALILLGRMRHGNAEQARESEISFARWRGSSEENAQAAATAERIWEGTHASGLQDTLALPRSAAQQRARRRQVTGTLAFGGLAVLLAGGARWFWQQPLSSMTLSTRRGQQLTRHLDDGSQIQLGADTALRATLWRDRRLLDLERGEARLSVTHDAGRPFIVQTPMGRVQVLGTVFSVSLRASGLYVGVEEGRVAIWNDAKAAPDSAPKRILSAGEWLLLDDRAEISSGTANPQAMSDWTHGWLLFENTPLSDAVARWNAYLRTPLTVEGGAQLASLRVTGSYRIADPQAFINSLPQMLPVRIQAQADGTVQIRPRR